MESASSYLQAPKCRIESIGKARVATTEQHVTIVEELGDVVIHRIFSVDRVLLKVSTAEKKERCGPPSIAGECHGNDLPGGQRDCAPLELTWPGKKAYSSPKLASRRPGTRRPSMSSHEIAFSNVALSVGIRSLVSTTP